MKKLLITILIALLLGLGYVVCIQGLEIGTFKINSLSGIKDLNADLDNQIEQVGVVAKRDYPAALSDLSSASKKLLSEKKNYEDLLAYSTEEEVSQARQVEKYESEVLWVKIGNYAKAEGVDPTLKFAVSSSGTPDTYDLQFTIVGSYIGISSFVRDLEDDSELGYKIESFKIVPNTQSDTSKLQATFVVKDIAAIINKVSTSTSSSNGTTATSQGTTGNTMTGGNTTKQ